VVRLGWASSQPSHPFGEYAARTLGYKKVAVLGSDYAFGYEVVGGFQKTFEEAGGQVIQKLWAPLGTADLSPYLTQIKREADAAFVVVVAASALKFPSQYQDAGLRGRLPVIGGAVITDESILPTFGDEALGIVTPLMYSAALDTPVNRRFVAEYRKRFQQGAVVFLRDLLYQRPLDQRGGARRERQRRGEGGLPGRLPEGRDPRCPRAAR
jgi:branched-chain amino acid transport system substrate-binding protein